MFRQIIADGEVIAYRVNDHYPMVDYGNHVAFFSTGFVLVRHLLEMERIPEQSQPSESLSTKTAPDTNDNKPTSTNHQKNPNLPALRLYFYSLYMHLADIAYYDKHPEKKSPQFWEQDIYRVIEHKDLEDIIGLRLRRTPNSQSLANILAVLQHGTKVNLNLKIHDENKKWYAVTSLVQGYTSIPELTPFEYQYQDKSESILGWIYTGKPITESEFQINGTDSGFVKSRGLSVKNADKSKIISILPVGAKIKITGKKKAKNDVELVAIIDGKPTIPLTAEKKRVYFDCLAQAVKAKEENNVVVLDKPYPIKAGQRVGYIGHYHLKGDFIKKTKDKEGQYIDIKTLPDDSPLTKATSYINICNNRSHYGKKRRKKSNNYYGGMRLQKLNKNRSKHKAVQ